MKYRIVARAFVFLVLFTVHAPCVDFGINTAITYQTIEGFGFFGGANVWWSGGPFYSDDWLRGAIDDLGMTMWRNEYYSEEGNQDANWAKQQATVQAIWNYATQRNVDMRMIWSVWSPPSRWKSNRSLKDGGSLLPQYYSDFGQWLKQGIDNYVNAGVQVYAISPQNECEFAQFYNSCVYTKEQYAEMLAVAGPIIRAAYPDVNIFACERMLTDIRQYEGYSLQHPTAKNYFDVLAVHNYYDGVSPTVGSGSVTRWRGVAGIAGNFGIPAWMTETSGYGSWKDYAFAMFEAIYWGHAAAWVHWQGSDEIMSGNGLTAKGNAMKHWARYVRPGAVMFDVDEPANDLYVTAFAHPGDAQFIIVAINSGGAATVNFTGSGVPAQFRMYQSTNGGTLSDAGMQTNGSITIPGNGMVTLVADNYSVSARRQIQPARSPLQGHVPRGAAMFAVDGRRMKKGNSRELATGVYYSIIRGEEGTTASRKVTFFQAR